MFKIAATCLLRLGIIAHVYQEVNRREIPTDILNNSTHASTTGNDR